VPRTAPTEFRRGVQQLVILRQWCIVCDDGGRGDDFGDRGHDRDDHDHDHDRHE
jgi:hypothetical protein